VYLFFQWLRIHANGTGIYTDIMNSAYSDYRAVETAVSTNISSNLSWDKILQSWYAANFLNNSTGLYGYKDQITGLARKTLPAGSAVSGKYALLPGEGVFSRLTASSFTPPAAGDGTHITYGGVNDAAKTLDLTAPFNTAASGNNYYLLTINANEKKNGLGESGYVANVQAAPPGDAAAVRAAAAQNDGYTPPELYRWDGARYFFDKLREGSGVLTVK
jgi:hypothetical protein